jgi:RNA polymerase sigma-70 factor (ECF subfamily)
MYNEADTIRDLKAGLDIAWKNLYEHHYKALCIVAFGYVEDTHVSEMIVSDVIFAIWENRGSLEVKHSFGSYLARSVRNRCLNYLAQSRRHRMLLSRAGEGIEAELENSHPFSRLTENELRGKIAKSLDSLPEQSRRIFCLSRFDGMKYEEIAREMNVSVDVVKYHIKSALSRLRIELKDYLTIVLIFLHGIS